MTAQFSINSSNPFFFQLDKKIPKRFALLIFSFIYLCQYLLWKVLPYDLDLPDYNWSEWLIAYGFVLFSVTIFMYTLVVGLSGKPVEISPIKKVHWQPKRIRVSLPLVIIIFAIFSFWSFLMLKLNIGITIWISFEPLPYRITGLLFYGRLFVQPMILAYIANGYANSKLKWLLLLLFGALGAWVSLTSGSRFAAVMFTFPIFMLFKGKSRYISLVIFLLIYIIIATLSRTFFLPFVIGNEDIIQTYSSLETREQEASIEKILLTPFIYIVIRSMGIAEVLMTLKFGEISPSFGDSMQSFIAYFVPYISPGAGASIKNVYGLDDDAFGGYGLDIFSNYWVAFGGNPVLYVAGLALIGWLLGKTYRQFAIGIERFGYSGATIFVFILLFILFFEARAFMFPKLFLLSWVISRKNTPRRVFAIFGALSLRQKLLPSQSLQLHPPT